MSNCKTLKANGCNTLCGMGNSQRVVQIMGSCLQNVINAKVNGRIDRTYLPQPGMHDIMIIDETPMFVDMRNPNLPYMSDIGDTIIDLVDAARIEVSEGDYAG